MLSIGLRVVIGLLELLLMISNRQRGKSKVPSGVLLRIGRVALRALPFALCAAFLCGKTAFSQPRQPPPPEQRIHYKIDLSLDFENRKYTGAERLRWVNRENHGIGTLIFHL